jgi:hypothetical protein
MAATKKSAKRSAGKKSSPTKKKGTKRKKAARGRATALKRRARKGLGAARDGFDSVLEAGGKTWRTLKNTTALMVEGVKETLSSEPETGARPRRRR